ncbi:MAG: hypothetical protein AB7S80_11885 [Rhizobiaceae bacterium]
MEMAGWFRLGAVLLVALVVLAFLLRPKKKARHTQRGDAPENPYTMSGPPNDGG